MRRHLLTRSLRTAGSLALLLVLNFTLPRLMPGDPVVHLLGIDDAVRFPEMATEVRSRYGLDRPLPLQFLRYLQSLALGDLGHSFHFGAPVGELVARRLGWTLLLVIPAVGIGGCAAGAAGALAGWRRGGVERGITLGILLLRSVPQYGVALVALYAVAFHGRAAPLGGVGGGDLPDVLRHAWLPVLVLALTNAAHLFLVMRGQVRHEGQRAYVAAARARGLSSDGVLWRHVVPNARLPFLALFALGLGTSVGGALLVEVVFSWPGMGTLILTAVEGRDYPLLQGCFLVITVAVLAANWFSDIACAWLDPRLRAA